MSEQDVWVAGLNHGAHDSSAALLRNGQLVAVVEQERFSRRKRAMDQPPVEALEWCLNHAGITLSDLSAIGLGSDHDVLAQWLGLTPEERRTELDLDNPERLFPKSVFGASELPPVVPVRHHLAHAASAYWASGYEESAVLVIDNRGEDESTTLAYATPDGIETLESYPIEHSLGLFYRIATQYVGLYTKDGNAGKLMGLASYGKPLYEVGLSHTPDGPRWKGVPSATTTGRALPPERTRQLLAFLEEQAFPYTVGLKDDIFSYIDFAASVQTALEDTILGLLRDLKERTGSANLCLAGGVALNCTANGRIAKEALFDNVYIQPMAHDAGCALGAAYEATREVAPQSFRPDVMDHALWGPEYGDDEILAALDSRGLRGERLTPDELVSQVASVIAQGGIVAWHQGRAEAGPRALGGRSLLGDPRHRSTLVRLNTIKKREMWRPLAPSVLADSYEKYFDGTPNPFMIMAAEVRPEVRSLIPAVVHVDGSARPQAVTREANPRYAALLEAFARESGIPILVNTSFNTAGMPLVNRPEESVDTFLDTDIDVLAIGSFLVRRPQ